MSDDEQSGRRPPLEVHPGVYEVCREVDDRANNHVLSGR